MSRLIPGDDPRRACRQARVVAVVAALFGACAGEPPAAERQASVEGAGDSTEVAAVAARRNPAGPRFVDVTTGSGLDFVHFNGASGAYYMPENMGGGGALLDFDRDGDLDLYLVQGTMLGERGSDAARFPPRHPEPLTDRLYRNDLEVMAGGEHRLVFTDITAEVGLAPAAYGMGAAAGDFDNDGWTDLYVTAFGHNRLLRNDDGRALVDVTAASGADDPRWSVPALFADVDRDGWLDLFVGNYLDFTFRRHRRCATKAGGADYCDPAVYGAVPDRLLRNRGDGTFEDVTGRAGLGQTWGKALGAVAADLDGDGWADLYVANDGTPNQLWRNRGDGTFIDEAPFAGCAVNADGRAEASMGVDAGDYDGDGDLDLVVSHLTGESHTLYRNEGGGVFEDATAAAGLAAASWEATGFGAGWLDADGDGRLDLVVVNGAVRAVEALVRRGDPYPFAQADQLFLNRGDGRFAEVTGPAAAAFARPAVSRGALFGDLDNDGDTDLVVVDNNGPARVLLNAAGPPAAWIGLRLVGEGAGRDMLGASVLLHPGDGAPPRRARAGADGSYAAGRDPRVLFALPAQEPGEAVDRVEVVWPDGRREEWRGLAPGRYTTLRQGTGRRVDP